MCTLSWSHVNAHISMQSSVRFHLCFDKIYYTGTWILVPLDSYFCLLCEQQCLVVKQQWLFFFRTLMNCKLHKTKPFYISQYLHILHRSKISSLPSFFFYELIMAVLGFFSFIHSIYESPYFVNTIIHLQTEKKDVINWFIAIVHKLI